MVMNAVHTQRDSALDRANEIRLARAQLRRDLRDGALTVEAAFRMECAQTMTIGELLRSQHRWGTLRVRNLLSRLHIFENRQVQNLTDRQRAEIVTVVSTVTFTGRRA